MTDKTVSREELYKDDEDASAGRLTARSARCLVRRESWNKVMGWLSDAVRIGLFRLRCSFCGGRAAEVERLVAGASALYL